MTGGLVVVRLDGGEEQAAIRASARAALAATPPGRFVSVLWPVALHWQEEPPVEATVSATLLGPPEARIEDRNEAVTLHASIAVRTYGDDPLLPRRCFQLLVLRRAGPGVAERRRAGGGAPEAAARLDTTRPAFTRDWANNVWHMRDAAAEDRIVARLARLLRWPDEPVLLVRSGGAVERWEAPAGGHADLVGVPERYAPAQGLLSGCATHPGG